MTQALRANGSLPDGAARETVVAGEGGQPIRLYHLDEGGPADRPLLVWGHANGFAAGSYLPFLRMLQPRMRILAFDLRGHGGSPLPGLAPGEAGKVSPQVTDAMHADRLAGDLAAVGRAAVAEAKGAPVYFAAHSVSGYAMVRLAGVHGEAPWQGALLFEPPIAPAPERPEHATAMLVARHLVAGALRRRRRWAGPDAFRASLADRPAYAAWDPEMLTAHTRATLAPAADGDGWELACAPEVEAAVYRMTLNPATFRALSRIAVPVTYVAGQPPGEGQTPSWAARAQRAAAERTPGARLVSLEGVGHMMPFEAPAACRDLVLGLLDAR